MGTGLRIPRPAALRLLVRAAALALGVLLPAAAGAECLPGLVRGPARPRLAAYGGGGERRVSIEWFGHSAFRLISPGGTRILTDPFGPEMGRPLPQVRPHVITVGREHPHHNSVHIAGGSPVVLRGLRPGGGEWADIRKTVGDVLIYNVPVTQRTYEMETKGSAFVFQMGPLCIAHLGDVAEALTPSQLRRLGKVHVALVPIGGTFTVDPEGAFRIVEALRPHIAIPMHYWDDEERLRRFLRGARRVRRHGSGPFYVSRRTLPRPTLFVVLGLDS